jgi:formimidoylglutamate deiminase
VLRSDHPSLYGRAGDLLLDSLVFSGNVSPVRDVMVGGRWRVRDGRHDERERIAERYRRTVPRLIE